MYFQPCNGFVGVEVSPNALKKGQFVISQDDERHIVSIEGKVVSVPKELPFYGNKGEALRKKYSDNRPEYIQHQLSVFNMKSLDFDTDIEIKIGDTVTFNYLSNLWGKEFVFGNILYIKYDQLYLCNSNPINGYLVVEKVSEINHSIFYIPPADNTQYFRVKQQANPLNGYRVFPYVKDESINLVNKKIAIRKGREVKYKNGILSDNTYLVQQKDILAYEV
jgi:hypothetical protein